MKLCLTLIFVSILTISMLFAGCSSTATSPQEPTSVEQAAKESTEQKMTEVEQAAKEATEQKRMELVTRLQQVNDELVRNMEEIFEVMDEMNRLNGAISSSMQRIQQAHDSINYWQKYGDVLAPHLQSADRSTIDQERQNISHYNFEIGKNRVKLRELQNKQLELEKERSWLLTELAKLGQ